MNNEIKKVSPFKHFCITIGNLPTSYLESMSYYETLCWLCKYLQDTINPAVNNNAEALEELQNYVSSYFDDLDVQEEINNKLDDMAESGELAEIINVEMIGTLSNLTTTDKTNVVSAINEVNSNISKFNLTHFKTYDLSTTSEEIIKTNGSIEYDRTITVATNDDGSICKIYGAFEYSNNTEVSQAGNITLKNTGLNPSSAFTIAPMGIKKVRGSSSTDLYTLGCKIASNGDITIEEGGMAAGQTRDCWLFPCIYFMKDFGD